MAYGKATVTIWQVANIPPLPEPSVQLTQVLDALHVGISPKGKMVHSPQQKKRRKTKRRVINGFIAFRTFYSRSLRDASLQTELSRQLGKLWEAEPNRVTWDCYASQYNATGGNQSFIDWLYAKLGLSPVREETTRREICKSYASRYVEDVFMD